MKKILLAIALLGTAADARPAPRAKVAAKAKASTRTGDRTTVSISRAGEMRPTREIVGRREEPLSPEEETAKQIEKLLRGPLRHGLTGLYVTDAKTGEPLFAVNADAPVNPASNVKMISTATALELLGPAFRYPTRVYGPTPVGGEVHGDLYLLGSYDPTLSAGDLDQLAASIAARGIAKIDGAIVTGADPTRDGLYRAVVPITVTAGAPGGPPLATPPGGFDFVTVKVAAKTAARAMLPRLSAKVTETVVAGKPHVELVLGGVIGKGGTTTYSLVVKDRTQAASYTLAAALRAHGVAIGGATRTAELGDYMGDAVGKGALPIELGKHASAPLAEIVARVNKWSINWLADRVVVTAAALVHRQPPSMPLAVDAMYDWLGRHPHLGRNDLVVDTGSGLSYRTRITAQELVQVVRTASGYDAQNGAEPAVAKAWLASLSIAGTDGTLTRRFKASDARGHLHGKTGTLSTAIALSGILDVDPQRPLAFSLVTNDTTPVSKAYVRRTHEQLVGLLVRYLAATHGAPLTPPPAPSLTPPDPKEVVPEDLEEAEPDPALDAEAARAK